MRSEIELVPYEPGMLEASPVLVLAPHPDDEVFGCGGLLATRASSGAEIHVVVVTDGCAQGEPATRRLESLAAARELGLDEPEFWAFRDRGLEASDPDLRERITDTLRMVRPRTILVTSPAEVHPDHRALALATYEAIRDGKTEVADEAVLAAYEVSAVLRPNLLVDVTPVWERVLSAARAFASQVEVRPYLEVFEAIATARRLTLPANVERAEAYHLVDVGWARRNPVVSWAARQGPSAGLEVDLPGAAPRVGDLEEELARVQKILHGVEGSLTWKVYRFFDRLRPRRP